MNGSPRLRPRLRAATAGALCLAAASLAAGCGSGKVEVPKSQPDVHRGAVLFNQRCSGCHSIEQANAYGSKPKRKTQATERTDGPNFNVRRVKRQDVLFAIRNGGFSGAIMPANIVVGADAQHVAAFLAKYSGGDRTVTFQGRQNRGGP